MLFDLEDPEEDNVFLEDENPHHTDLTPAQHDFFGHENVERQVVEMINNDRLPHALILSGMEGVGKATFAFRLVRFLLTRAPDNEDSLFGAPEKIKIENLTSPLSHPAQAQISSGGHPDLLSIERGWDDKKDRRRAQLDVDEIRKIVPFLRRTAAYDGGYRIVVIDDCDTMNRNSQNALLKILEEPPEKTLLILITHRLGALLPTILSRAAVLNFQPLSDVQIQNALQSRGIKLTHTELGFVTDYAQGSLGNALMIAQEHALLMIQDSFNFFKSPSFDWSKIQIFAEALAMKSSINDDMQKLFIESHIFLADVAAKIGMLDKPLPAWMEGFAFLTSRHGNKLELGERLRHLKSLTYQGNLDRRFLVMESYRLWEEICA